MFLIFNILISDVLSTMKFVLNKKKQGENIRVVIVAIVADYEL